MEDQPVEVVAANQNCSVFEQLPVDTSRWILSYLEFSDLLQLSACCRRLYDAVSQASHIFMDGAHEPATACKSKGSTTYTKVVSTRHHHPIYKIRPRHSVQMGIRVSALQFDKRSLRSLLERFTHLKELHLSGLAPVGDALFKLLNQAPTASILQSLTLHGAILTYCCTETLQLPHLRRLRLVGGSIRASLALLLGKTVEMAPLEYLSIAQCSTLRDDQLQMLLPPLNESLEELNVHQCSRIRRPRVQLAHLKRLSFMGCFALSELPNLYAPVLCELNLSFCFRMETRAIQEAMECLPSLEVLTLVKCELLHSLAVHSKPKLRTLNVSHCNALVHLKVTNCPALSFLENKDCFMLHTVELQNVPSLKYLNLSTLPISRLVVSASHLLHLELENCQQLHDCWIRSPRLQHVNLRGSRAVALSEIIIRSDQLQNINKSRWMPLGTVTMSL